MRIISLCLFLALLSPPAAAQWVPTGGPEGGTINSVATNGPLTYAATFNGVFRSTDLGTTWMPFSTGLSRLDLTCVRTDGPIVFCASAGKVFVSLDNGEQWGNGGTGLPTSSYIRTMALLPDSAFAGTDYNGVYRSTDNGTSWTAVNTGLADTNITSISVVQTAVQTYLFTGTISGLYRSSNGGSMWNLMNNGLGSSAVTGVVDPGPAFLAGTMGGAFRSTDEGGTWSESSSGLTNPAVTSVVNYFPNVLAGTTNGIYLSTNSGSQWAPANSGLSLTQVVSLAAHNTDCYAGTFGGMFVSTDFGLNWKWANHGLVATSIGALAIDGAAIYAGSDGSGVYRSTDRGTTWEPRIIALTGNPRVISVLAAGSTVLAGTYYGGIYRSTDQGATWSRDTAGLNQNIVYAFAKSGPDYFAGGDRGVSRAINGGPGWTYVSNGLPSSPVRSLVVNGSRIFAGTFGSGVFVSTDNGATWDTANAGMTLRYVYSMASIGNTVFAGGDIGVFLTTDGGTTWSPTPANPTFPFARCMATFGNNLFIAGGPGAVYVTSDMGAHWKNVSQGIQTVGLNVLLSDGTDLFGGTYNSGVVRRPLSEMVTSVADRDGSTLPEAYSLSNFPNPFNPSTTVEYVLVAKGHVKLGVWDYLGREVVTLVDEEKPAGRHEVRWDARGSSSGIFFCRLQVRSSHPVDGGTGDRILVRKFVLIR